MAKKKKVYDDDDGRVIAKMNVDGMPWYMGKPTGSGSYRGSDEKMNMELPERKVEPLSKHETLQIMLASMKWALFIGLIFSAAGVLFVLFCTEVWFK